METAMAIAGGVFLFVLLPEQLQRDIGLPQLLVNGGVLRLGPRSCRRWRRRWKQFLLQRGVIQPRRQRPTYLCRFRPFEEAPHRSLAQSADIGDLAFTEPGFVVQSEDFFNPSHGCSFLGQHSLLRFQETMPPRWNHPAPLTPPARSEKAGAAFR